MPPFIIEIVSLPPAVEAARDKRTEMGVLGNVDQYTKFQAATAVTEAAQNPRRYRRAGVGIGVGAALGAQLAQALQPRTAAIATTLAPPPLPSTTLWYLGAGCQQGGPAGPVGGPRAGHGQHRDAGDPGRARGMGAWVRLDDVPDLQAAFWRAAAPAAGVKS